MTYNEPFGVSIEIPPITLANVKGYRKLKEKVVDVIVNPISGSAVASHYKKFNNGILLYGPSGCGKSYLVRAAAGTVGASLITVRSREAYQKPEKNAHELFELARKNQPCIIFFEDLACIPHRYTDMELAYEKVFINQIIFEIDNIIEHNDNILIVAESYAPWDFPRSIITRFTRFIYVPEPDLNDREEILKMYLEGKQLSSNINFKALAEMTVNYTSINIKMLVQEAEKVAGEQNFINTDNFKKAFEKVGPDLSLFYKYAKKLIGPQELIFIKDGKEYRKPAPPKLTPKMRVLFKDYIEKIENFHND